MVGQSDEQGHLAGLPLGPKGGSFTLSWASSREEVDMAVQQARDRMVKQMEEEAKRRRDLARAARYAAATRQEAERAKARQRAAEEAAKAEELAAAKAAKQQAMAMKAQAKLEAQANAKAETAQKARAEAEAIAAAQRKEAERMRSGPALLFDPNAAIAAAESEWRVAASEAAVAEAAMAQAELIAAHTEHELRAARDRKHVDAGF